MRWMQQKKILALILQMKRRQSNPLTWHNHLLDRQM
jgi:hypothetical protein